MKILKKSRYILNHGFSDLLFPNLERVIIDHKPGDFLSREEGLKKLLASYNEYHCELNAHIDALRKEYLEAETELSQLCNGKADEPEEKGTMRELVGYLADFIDLEGTTEEKKKAFRIMMNRIKESLRNG